MGILSWKHLLPDEVRIAGQAECPVDSAEPANISGCGEAEYMRYAVLWQLPHQIHHPFLILQLLQQQEHFVAWILDLTVAYISMLGKLHINTLLLPTTQYTRPAYPTPKSNLQRYPFRLPPNLSLLH